MDVRANADVTGAEIKAMRELAGMTQAEIAKLLGMTRNGYAHIEEGAVQDRHVLMIEGLSLRLAVEKKNPEIAFAEVRERAKRLYRIEQRVQLV